LSATLLVYDAFEYLAISDIAHANGIPLIVDATFTTPFTCCAASNTGRELVVNSLTKWLGGHGTTIGGIITDAGTINWAWRKTPPLLLRPTPRTTACAGPSTSRHPSTPIAFALRVRTVPAAQPGHRHLA
jgi:O-acetylhomoserine (thiol)-lyase